MEILYLGVITSSDRQRIESSGLSASYTLEQLQSHILIYSIYHYGIEILYSED